MYLQLITYFIVGKSPMNFRKYHEMLALIVPYHPFMHAAGGRGLAYKRETAAKGS